MNKLDKIFIHPRYFENGENLRKARILRNASLLTSIFSLTYVSTCLLIDFKVGLIVMISNFLTFLILPFLLKTKTPFLFIANLYITAGAFAIFIVIHYSGGLISPVMPWIAASPAIAMMVTNKKSAFIWLAICLLAALAFTFSYYYELTPEAGYNTAFGYNTYFFSISLIGLVAIVFVINNVFETAKSKALNEVELKNKEITEINEELLMQKEEIEAQRDTIEEKNITLEKTHVEIVEKNRLIEKKNEDITSSINYARRIQEAMLPPIKEVCEAMGDAFILFRPRDIVSGDFYWYGETKGRKIIAAMDCTGHGVPGALMSMIGFNLLNEIVMNKGIVLPGRIFEELDKGVIKALKQDTTSNRDGMDGCICCIFEENGKQIVEFAGAKNPLVMVKNGEYEKIRGNKSSIGGGKTGHILKLDKEYDTHRLEAEQGTLFYLYSDGYQDQFGGPKNSKFMSKKLNQLLADNAHLPMEKQKEGLENSLLDWMGEEEAIDDVLLIGFKV